MKRSFLFLSIITVFAAACSNAASDNKTEETQPSAVTTEEPVKEMSAGEKLIAKSDCIGCHNANNKLIGPAYVEIAAKYTATDQNLELLADKVIKGGTGVWGEVPMTAHPNISKEDAKEMLKYILSLKK